MEIVSPEEVRQEYVEILTQNSNYINSVFFIFKPYHIRGGAMFIPGKRSLKNLQQPEKEKIHVYTGTVLWSKLLSL